MRYIKDNLFKTIKKSFINIAFLKLLNEVNFIKILFNIKVIIGQNKYGYINLLNRAFILLIFLSDKVG